MSNETSFREQELPVWPEARAQVPSYLRGKTAWTRSPFSPANQPTGGGPLAPSPFPDAPDSSPPANANRTDAATAAGTAAIAKLQTEATLVGTQLTSIGALLPAATITVTSVAANSGPLAGGTAVTVTGTGFTGATSCTFSGVPGTAFSVTNATTIAVTTPRGAVPGPVGVRVVSPTTAGYRASAFTYNSPPAAPTSVSPFTVAVAGGTPVTITGTGFTGTTAVTFGGTTATAIVVVSDTRITCNVPAHAAGAVNVVVTAPGGAGTLTNGVTYA